MNDSSFLSSPSSKGTPPSSKSTHTEKIGAEDSKKHNSSAPSSSPASPFTPDLTNSDLDLLKKLQTDTIVT